MTVTLTGMTWDHPRGHDSVVAASDEYVRRHPEVRIEWRSRSLQAFADHPLEDLAREFDLLVIDHPHIALAAASGILRPLDEPGREAELAALAAASVGGSHESYSALGRQYGLAIDAAAQVSVRRPDLLPTAPETWAEVLDLAVAGRVLWPYKPIDAFSSLITIAGNHGAVPMSRPGVFLTPEEAAPALEIMHRLAESVPERNASDNPIDVAELLAAESGFAYVPLAFGYTNYSRAGFRAARLAYSDIPSGPHGRSGSLLGGAGIAVSAESTHPETAVDVAFWLDSAEVQRGVYFDGGGQPGHRAAWDDDRTNAETLDFFRATRATLDGAYTRPRSTGYLELQDAGSPLVTAALTGEITDARLLDDLDRLVEQHLG